MQLDKQQSGNTDEGCCLMMEILMVSASDKGVLLLH